MMGKVGVHDDGESAGAEVETVHVCGSGCQLFLSWSQNLPQTQLACSWTEQLRDVSHRVPYTFEPFHAQCDPRRRSQLAVLQPLACRLD